MKQNAQKKESSYSFWLPVLIVLLVIPLITVIHIYDNGLSKEAWASSSGTTYDFFLYYKSRILMLIGLVVTGLLGYRILQGDRGNFTTHNSYIPMIPLGVYALFSLVSALFSRHPKEAFFGGYEQFEGVLVVLTYLVCFFLVYGYIQTEQMVSVLLHALIIGSLIVSVLGVFQAFSLDWIQSGWARGLLTPELSGMGNFTIKLNFEKGMAYSTLYNPNYVGSYVAIALPITAALAIWAKRIVFKCLAGLSTICQLIMLYASQSLTGFIGLAGAAIVVIVFLFPYTKKHKIVSLCAFAVCAAALVFFCFVKNGWINRLLKDDTADSSYTIESITTKKNTFEIVTGTKKTLIGHVPTDSSIYSFSLTDKEGNPLPYQKQEDDSVTITEQGYENISFAASAVTVGDDTLESIEIQADGNTYDLVMSDGRLRYYTPVGKLDKLYQVKSFGFENHLDFATRRGYIWSRTFPLLSSTVLFGVGQDNFVYEFPNDDYVGKVNSSFDAQIITKPHNMYLQIWVQDGMFACLALIALFVMLAVSTLKNCFGSGQKTWLQKIAIAILCSASGYMLVGLANDATICVAPVFWILTALGFAVNHRIRRCTSA